MQSESLRPFDRRGRELWLATRPLLVLSRCRRTRNHNNKNQNKKPLTRFTLQNLIFPHDLATFCPLPGFGRHLPPVVCRPSSVIPWSLCPSPYALCAPAPGSPARITFHASRFTHHVSHITFHASRFTLHVSRFTSPSSPACSTKSNFLALRTSQADFCSATSL
jgi:hypothetical protein